MAIDLLGLIERIELIQMLPPLELVVKAVMRYVVREQATVTRGMVPSISVLLARQRRGGSEAYSGVLE